MSGPTMQRIGLKKETVGPYNQNIISTLGDSGTHVKPFIRNNNGIKY